MRQQQMKDLNLFQGYLLNICSFRATSAAADLYPKTFAIEVKEKRSGTDDGRSLGPGPRREVYRNVFQLQ